MNSKLLFMSIVVLGLIVNISYSAEFAFGDKPDKGEPKSKKVEAKAAAQDKKSEVQNKKAEAQTKKAEAQTKKSEVQNKKDEAQDRKAEAQTAAETKKGESKGNEVEEFANGVVVESSSTTTICHIPPGNPANNHTITIGMPAWQAHEKHGDAPIPCEEVNWEEFELDSSKKVKEFENGVVVESSSTTTICHIPPGNPANNHTITIAQSAWPAHEKHGDKPIPCEEVIWKEPVIDTQVETETTENNSDLAQQISQQIAELQKRLQQLFGF